ncbi:MAG: ferritin-like domain-containing protein [Fluviibacter sp.]
MRDFFEHLEAAWSASSTASKCHAVDALIPAYLAFTETDLLPGGVRAAPDCARIGRPVQPVCVPPESLPFRKATDKAGRAALLHAIAHIEFNAINLALDAAWRFKDLGSSFVRDWVGVAIEESYHFKLIESRLQALGVAYGDLPAHAGLWHLAERTTADVLARMALVPRLMEARGLDAMPPIFRAFQGIGDKPTLRALSVIARDEVRHVALGDSWFRALCKAQALPVSETYQSLIDAYGAPRPRPPMNEAARLAAGFDSAELELLNAY